MKKINELLDYGLLAELAYLKLEDKNFKESNKYLTDIELAPLSYKKQEDVVAFIKGIDSKKRNLYSSDSKEQENIRYEKSDIKFDRIETILELLKRYEIKEFTSDDGYFSSDFQAMLFQRISTDEYIIAFRGTSSVKDGLVDGALANILGSHNFQENEAIEFIEKVKKKYKILDDKLSFTGHSLGGILSQTLGVKLKVRAFAYNPMGTSSLVLDSGSHTFNVLIEALHAFGITSIDEEWVNKNIITLSYNDIGAFNGDVLSNIVTKLNGSKHLGIKIDFFGKNVDVGEGHSIITLNKLLEQQSKHNFTTLEDIKNYNKHEKTLFLTAILKQKLDILISMANSGKGSLAVQTHQGILPIIELEIKNTIEQLNHLNMDTFTITANIKRAEDKDDFDKKLYYNHKKNKLSLKTESFKESASIINLISKENNNLKKHDIKVELQEAL